DALVSAAFGIEECEGASCRTGPACDDVRIVSHMTVQIEFAKSSGEFDCTEPRILAEAERVEHLRSRERACRDVVGLLFSGWKPARLHIPAAQAVVAGLNDLSRARCRVGEDFEGDRCTLDLETVIAGLGINVFEVARRLHAP